jgi:type VI secretion system secreted protein Hcp
MASDAFIQIGSVKGEATDDKHADWIEVYSWSIGATQSGSPYATTGSTTGKADVSDFNFTHPLDLSSAKLFELCCTGENTPKVVFEAQKSAGKSKQVYIKITMENAIVSSVQPSGSQGGDAMESVGLRFSKIEYDYTQQKDDGSSGGNMSAKWDLKKSVAS